MKVALLCDSPDENWPSMDLVGQMHAAQLTALGIPHQAFAPPVRRLTPSFSLNRLLLRFRDYPRLASRLAFDLYHVIDHSYSQLVHVVPPGRAVVTCHDIDTFRSVLEPQRDPRGPAFRLMTQRILSGFRQSAHVACDSAATYDEIRKFDLIPAARLSVVPLGVHPSCSPEADGPADAEAARLLNGFTGPALLHVGSTIARKRIDLLLRIFAGVHARRPEIRLIRVGGPLTPAQRELADELKLDGMILELPFLDRPVLAAVYRRSTLALQPSSAEGFGLPVAEAMACGTPVVASDLPVLREVGGSAALYCTVDDEKEWVSTILDLLASAPCSLRANSLNQASHFSWLQYSKNMADVYNSLLNL